MDNFSWITELRQFWALIVGVFFLFPMLHVQNYRQSETMSVPSNGMIYLWMFFVALVIALTPEAYYRDASIVCMTSTFEGAPMVLREAVMYACVPVAFNSFSSASEVILDGETGFLVPAFDLNRYVEILAILMTDEVLRKKMALAAKHRGSNWSIERVGSAWVNLFKEISEEKRSEKEV